MKNTKHERPRFMAFPNTQQSAEKGINKRNKVRRGVRFMFNAVSEGHKILHKYPFITEKTVQPPTLYS